MKFLLAVHARSALSRCALRVESRREIAGEAFPEVHPWEDEGLETDHDPLLIAQSPAGKVFAPNCKSPKVAATDEVPRTK
jgi:hypothetical protein